MKNSTIEIFRAKVDGSSSVGYVKYKTGEIIFAFRKWGKLYWSGDLENMRNTKHEAFQDAQLTK